MTVDNVLKAIELTIDLARWGVDFVQAIRSTASPEEHRDVRLQHLFALQRRVQDEIAQAGLPP